MFSGFIHVVAVEVVTFHGLITVPLYGYSTFCAFIDGHLSCFHLLDIKKNAVNTHVQVLFEHTISVLLGIYLTVESLGHVVTLCLIFLRTSQATFRRFCTILPSCQQCMRCLVSSHLCQYS